MMEFLQSHAPFLIAMIIAGAISFYCINYPQKIKEWLVWACAQAELALGSKTGMLKLREVYDMFLTQYPIVSKLVPFSVFKKWTEDALVTFKDWLVKNAAAQELFGGDENEKEN